MNMELNFSTEKYNDFRNKIKEALNEITLLNNIEYEKEVKDSIVIEKENNFFFEFICFTNHQKWIVPFLNFDSEDSEKLLKEFFKIKIYKVDNNSKNNFNIELFKIILHMFLYSLIKIENIIASVYKIFDLEQMKENDIREINDYYLIIIQILTLLLKLYKENIYEIGKIILFFDIIIIFIKKMTIVSDIYYKLKNIILFDILLEKFYIQFLKLILHNNSDNKNDISLFLNYLIKIFQNKQIKTDFNISILTKINIFPKIISVLFNNINYKDIQIYQDNKDKLIDCFSDLYLNNTHNINFFESLINKNKESFVNLINYHSKKDNLINDIYTQNFGLELLKTIFSKEKDINNKINKKIPIENYFVFNGEKSIMEFYISSISLENSILFFSFKLSNDILSIKNYIFPLIMFETEDKNISFEIFIKKENNNYKLYIYQDYQDKKKEKHMNEICLGNISTDDIYYLATNFEDKKLYLFIKSSKVNDFHQSIETFNIEKKSSVMKIKIGSYFDSKEKKAFKGYIGPIILIKNLSNKKKTNINNIIKKILDLKNLYHLFPYFMCKKTNYKFHNLFIFPSSKVESEIKEIIYYFQKIEFSFQCDLYLTPEILNVFYSLVLKSGNDLSLPKIPDICLTQNQYIIIFLNISTKIKGNIFVDFIRNNGLYYFCLVCEYIYQYYNLILQGKIELNKIFNNVSSDIIDKIIMESVKAFLIILNNYTSYKFIVNNQKSFKTLFRNIYYMLICSNRISNKIFSGISRDFFDLIFSFKYEERILQNVLDKYPTDKNFKEGQRILSNFSNGLIDMIYSPSLYETYQGENYLKSLFDLHQHFIIHHPKDKTKNKNEQFPFKCESFFEILGLSKILEKSFTYDNKYENVVITSFFNLLKNFLFAIEPDIRQIYFKKLIEYIIKNNEYNLFVTSTFLKFIYKMLIKHLDFEFKELELILDYYVKINEHEKENTDKIIIGDINVTFAYILLRLILYGKFGKTIDKICQKLENMKYNEILLSNIISELKKIIDEILKSYKNEEDMGFLKEVKKDEDNVNYMDLFENVFNLINNLLMILINKKPMNKEFSEKNNSKTKNEMANKDNLSNLVNLLFNLTKTLESEYIKNYKNEYCIYCIINFLKFYHRIISEQSIILKYSDLKFTENIIAVINLVDKYNLINYSKNFIINYNNGERKISIIEMIYEITMNFFLNDDYDKECYNNLFENNKYIFFDRKFSGNKKFSIFFVNDKLKYFADNIDIKKKKKELSNLNYDIQGRCMNLNFYKKIFKDEDNFEGIFATYFLQKIFESQKIFKTKNLVNSPIQKLNEFLDDLSLTILEEHKLFDKDFLKKNCSDANNELLLYIREKYAKKGISLDELKKYYESLSEKNKIEKNNIKRNSNKLLLLKCKTFNIETNKGFEETKIDDNNNNKNNLIECTKDIKKIQYFFDLDKYYITNIKKEIMNCIFSIYYLDEFFHDDDFTLIKKYYMNYYINVKEKLDSKQLNYPTVMKNYRNNFEPPLFIKKYNNFVIDPYFDITHSYINGNNDLKKYINMKKSIKFQKKNIPIQETAEFIECEIIKNEISFYGKLFYDNSWDYFVFKEEKKDFTGPDQIKYIFLLSYFLKTNISYFKKKKTIDEKKEAKNIIILKEEIEEIVEIRIFLLWKGCEIFLKNGKSYIFNFLSTIEYDKFLKNIIFKSKLNNLLRKRNFLSEGKIITKEWEKGLISNFEYILLLNRYGSRSYNDPTQYPVFPWLLFDYKSLEYMNKKEKIFSKIIRKYKDLDKSIKFELINKKEKMKLDKIIFDELKEKDKAEFKPKIEEIKKQSKEKITSEDKKENKIKKEKNEKEEKKMCKEENELENVYVIKAEDYLEMLSKIYSKILRILRSFEYPPSFQEKEKREQVIYKYVEDEQNKTKFPSHTGCHYSTSGYIYYYLMRQQPYDNLLVKLQGYNLENTNRCFISISSLQQITNSGADNRELIPEFFSKIEYFLNLNCDAYGKCIVNNDHLDDCTLDTLTNKTKTYLSKFVTFIIQHKILLNSQIIGNKIIKWIDILFGANQIPDKEKRKDSCIIFSKYAYEQNVNLENKLNKLKNLKKLSDDKIIQKIKVKITYIINFGLVPSQIFKEKHKVLKSFNDEINDNINTKKKEENIIEIEDDDLELAIGQSIGITKKLERKLNYTPTFFKINPTLNKIFIYTDNNSDKLKIYDCEAFNPIFYMFIDILSFNSIENTCILNYGEKSTYQIKYSFSSFDNEKLNISDDKDEFHTYYHNRINFFINKQKIINQMKNMKKSIEIIKVLTCRHLDFSFKIIYLIKAKADRKKEKEKDKEETKKIFSYVCEDFVTSCCCLSSNNFVIGLNNGKLIFFKIKFNTNNIDTKKNVLQSIEKIKIEKEKYIQAHRGKINMIEIDKNLGVIITAGDDNFIFIRKLYDLEMLLPIKIKNKFIILMVKISPFNFLYVLCLNKINNKKIIFGYTLSGLRFAKSEYGSYDNINITEEGNIIAMIDKKKITFLSGNDLRKINNSELNEDATIIDEIKNVIPQKCIQYDYLYRMDDDQLKRIITYFTKNEKNEYIIKTLDLSDVLD